MQMFKQPVKQVTQGDRVGVCVTQLDAKARTACAPPLARRGHSLCPPLPAN